MGGAYGPINSRVDFDALLQKATLAGKTLLAGRPDDPAIAPIVRQLEAVAAWSADGRNPTKEQRSTIDLSSAREPQRARH